MKLFALRIRQQLIENGIRQEAVRGTEDEIDFIPVVKLFTPDAGATWLLPAASGPVRSEASCIHDSHRREHG